MKPLITLFTLIAVTGWSSASYALNADQAIKNCLANWGKHPFNARHPKYRVIGSKVNVFGIGGKIHETKATKYPELVLIKPNVSVLSKSRMTLTNPKGWYCLHGKVNVLSKMYITLGCKSHIATSREGVSVLAKDENEQGVTVLSKAYVTRDCK